MSRVIVVGGGAAGMMAAYRAAENGHQVELLEQNEKLGKKVYITGKGRCNVTNDCETYTFFDSVVTNPRFLYSAVYDFDQPHVCALLEENGCPLKVERGGRVFPVSDHSSDVIRAMQRALEKKGVHIRLHTKVQEILTRPSEGEETAGKPEICGVRLSDGKALQADRVILCTGGLSYPTTGSTGDGYRFAEKLGHTVKEPVPSLVPLETAETWPTTLQGLALKNVEINLKLGKKEVYSGFGEMLFTHFGVSGPLVLSASCYLQQALSKAKKPEKIRMTINLKPALSEEQLDARLLREFESHKNRQFKNSLEGLFPSRLIPVMLSLSGIDPDRMVNSITREERRAFLEIIRALPMEITGTRAFTEAIITQGGVNVREINPSTMESRLVSGLFMAGELLDVDALTGGYNLQIAWSTGHLAGDCV